MNSTTLFNTSDATNKVDTKTYIPEVNQDFIPFGEYEDVESVLIDRTNKLNMLISGPKGCGKTEMIHHIHAKHGLPMIRVNITIESDEDSLMGGLRLLNGNTVFDKGPVLRAMEAGITLLLDEVDLGHPTKLMCLQSVLEHKGYHIKKTGEMVHAKPGFKIISTANTKGRGDETGQYIGTQILNSAMLDRISLFFDWNYPEEATEKKILNKKAERIQLTLPEAINKSLVIWANGIRAGNVEDVDTDETISTRKLCDIVETYRIFKDVKKAIRRSISGFDNPTVEAFLAYYDTIDPNDTSKNSGQKVKQKTLHSWNVT